MPVNVYGPGHYADTGSVAARPTPMSTGKSVDHWFAQCAPGDPSSGTRIDDQLLNSWLAAFRQFVRTNGAAEAELSDDMLAEAACRAASGAIYGVDGGAVNAHVITTANFVVPKSYFLGLLIEFLPAVTNTGAATVNAWGLGVKALRKPDGTALAGGEVQVGVKVRAWYDPAGASGAGAFRLDPWCIAAGGGGSSAGIFPGMQFGQELSKAAATTLGVSAGTVANDAGTANIILAAFTKNVAAVFAAGTTAGALDTGVLASSTWYHVFSIRKDDGTADVLISLSGTAPTMPTGYTTKRIRGSIFIDSSAEIRNFVQHGDVFYWHTPAVDIDITNPDQLGNLRTLAVPSTRRVVVRANVLVDCQGGDGDKSITFYATPPDVADTVWTGSGVGSPSAPLADGGTWDNGGADGIFGSFQCLTNTSAQIRMRVKAASASTGSAASIDKLKIATVAWADRRGA